MASSGGRPPGPTDETNTTLRNAAFRLLVVEGPAALTPLRIHRETGIARTTVYRHWPTARHIVEEILDTAIARHEQEQLTGDVGHDLPVALQTLLDRFRHRPVAAFYRATLAVDDGELPSLAERYIAGLIAPVHEVLAAAVSSGDIDGDADTLASEICGPLLLDHLLLGRAVGHTDATDIADDFLRGKLDNPDQ